MESSKHVNSSAQLEWDLFRGLFESLKFECSESKAQFGKEDSCNMLSGYQCVSCVWVKNDRFLDVLRAQTPFSASPIPHFNKCFSGKKTKQMNYLVWCLSRSPVPKYYPDNGSIRWAKQPSITTTPNIQGIVLV